LLLEILVTILKELVSVFVDIMSTSFVVRFVIVAMIHFYDLVISAELIDYLFFVFICHILWILTINLVLFSHPQDSFSFQD